MSEPVGNARESAPLEAVVSSIADRLTDAMTAYTVKTGLDVWCIYLGRTQMRELIAWSKSNCLVVFDPADLEGKGRPEYSGALVFEVNDDDHLNVS